MTGPGRLSARLAAGVAVAGVLLGACGSRRPSRRHLPVAAADTRESRSTPRALRLPPSPSSTATLEPQPDTDGHAEPHAGAHTRPVDHVVRRERVAEDLGHDLSVHRQGIRRLCDRTRRQQGHLRRGDLEAAQGDLHQEGGAVH